MSEPSLSRIDGIRGYGSTRCVAELSLRESSVPKLDGRLLSVLMDIEPTRVDDSVEWAQGPKLPLESA